MLKFSLPFKRAWQKDLIKLKITWFNAMNRFGIPSMVINICLVTLLENRSCIRINLLEFLFLQATKHQQILGYADDLEVIGRKIVGVENNLLVNEKAADCVGFKVSEDQIKIPATYNRSETSHNLIKTWVEPNILTTFKTLFSWCHLCRLYGLSKIMRSKILCQELVQQILLHEAGT